MVLDTKKYELRNGVEGYRQDVWKLTKMEMKLLRLFADNEVHSSDEIFKKCKFKNKNTTRVLIYRLKKKIKELKLVVIAKVGYRLENYIKIK